MRHPLTTCCTFGQLTHFEYFNEDEYIRILKIDFVLRWHAFGDFLDDLRSRERIMIPHPQLDLVLDILPPQKCNVSVARNRTNPYGHMYEIGNSRCTSAERRAQNMLLTHAS